MCKVIDMNAWRHNHVLWPRHSFSRKTLDELNKNRQEVVDVLLEDRKTTLSS